DTQRTLYPVRDVRLLPAREFPLDEGGRTRFRGRLREAFEGDPSRSPLYKDVSAGVVPGGIEYYLPLFFEATATLVDYLPRDARVAFAANHARPSSLSSPTWPQRSSASGTTPNRVTS